MSLHAESKENPAKAIGVLTDEGRLLQTKGVSGSIFCSGPPAA